MSKRLRNAAAKRVIDEMKPLPEAEQTSQPEPEPQPVTPSVQGSTQGAAQTGAASAESASASATSDTSATPVDTIEKRPKEQLNTNVDVRVKQAIMVIQQDVVAKGFKKPKMGEIIEEAVMKLLKERGLTVDS